MNMRFFIILSLLVGLNVSCYSYKIYPKKIRKLEPSINRYNAYVIEDYLREELKILESSKIFNITSDSLKADLKIKLYPLENINNKFGYTIFGWNTGEDLSFGLVTAGQIPIMFDENIRFKFDEISQAGVIKKDFVLKLTRRYWFWDVLDFNKNYIGKAGKALLGNYLGNK